MAKSIPDIDPMSVFFFNEVKKPHHKPYQDQLVKDFLGNKVGNVPANLAGFFRNCILLVHLFQELHRLFTEELCFFLSG